MAEADKKNDDAKKDAAAGAATPKEGEAAPAADEGAGKKKKKKIIIIGIAGIAILIIAIIGIYFGFIKGKKSEAEGETANAEEVSENHDEAANGEAAGQGGGPTGPIYLELKEFLVNLNSTGKQASFLKMVVTLELPTIASKAAIEANMPRIIDAFQIYLRELRTEDLRGSAGIQLLREELLLRINKIVAPEKVNDILFKEIIVQ